MKAILNNLLPVLALSIAGLLLFFSLDLSPKTAGASVYDATRIGNATTSAAVAVTSSTRILASTTNALGNGTSYTRIYATICNPSATLVYLNLNGDNITHAPLGKYTAVIAAAAGYNSCYEVTDKNLTQGSITASSTNETSVNVVVQDYVQ